MMMIRGDGTPLAKLKCFEPIIEKLDEIEHLIEQILKIKGLEAEESFIMQSRAMGTCKPTSDLDMYVALSIKHENLIEEKGVMLYESFEPTSFTGSWHPIENESQDKWSIGHRWPYKILHDMDAPQYYDEPPKITDKYVDRMEELKMHINYGIHPIPPKKKEYNSRHYASLSELRILKELLYEF